MPGDYSQKFASLRLFFGYMICHPGKKLLFMGGEFGQFIEWNHNIQLDWFLLEYSMHKKLQQYTKALNEFYKEERALWEQDHTSEGFAWIEHENSNESIITFMRKGKASKDFLIVVCNFTKVIYENYKVGVPKFINYKEVFNSDNSIFGGSNKMTNAVIKPTLEVRNNKPYCINIKIPPLSILFIKPINDTEGGLI